MAAPTTALGPRLTLAKATAFVIALAVHCLALGALGVGVYLIWAFFPNPLPIILGIALCGFAWLLVPHTGKLPDDVLDKSRFPALHEFVNTVARQLGGRPVDRR